MPSTHTRAHAHTLHTEANPHFPPFPNLVPCCVGLLRRLWSKLMSAGLCKLPTGLPRLGKAKIEARQKFLSWFFKRRSWMWGWPLSSLEILLAKPSLCLHDNIHLGSLDQRIAPNKSVQQASVQSHLSKELKPSSVCCSMLCTRSWHVHTMLQAGKISSSYEGDGKLQYWYSQHEWVQMVRNRLYQIEEQ